MSGLKNACSAIALTAVLGLVMTILAPATADAKAPCHKRIIRVVVEKVVDCHCGPAHAVKPAHVVHAHVASTRVRVAYRRTDDDTATPETYSDTGMAPDTAQPRYLDAHDGAGSSDATYTRRVYRQSYRSGGYATDAGYNGQCDTVCTTTRPDVPPEDIQRDTYQSDSYATDDGNPDYPVNDVDTNDIDTGGVGSYPDQGGGGGGGYIDNGTYNTGYADGAAYATAGAAIYLSWAGHDHRGGNNNHDHSGGHDHNGGGNHNGGGHQGNGSWGGHMSGGNGSGQWGHMGGGHSQGNGHMSSGWGQGSTQPSSGSWGGSHMSGSHGQSTGHMSSGWGQSTHQSSGGSTSGMHWSGSKPMGGMSRHSSGWSHMSSGSVGHGMGHH